MSLRLALSRKNTLELATARYEAALDAETARYLVARGVTKEVALKARLGLCSSPFPEHEQMQGRLAIPYLTVTGPLTIKFRCIRAHNCKEEGCPKYMAEADQPPLLFNATDLLRDEDSLFVCEGELDAVVVSGVCGLPCVAFPGASNWRPYFNRAVGPDWGAIRVIADGDKPGRDAARDVAKHLRARVVKMPDGHDATSFLMEFGRDALVDKLKASI